MCVYTALHIYSNIQTCIIFYNTCANICTFACVFMLLLRLYRPMFDRRSETDSLLIVQCDSGHLYGDLIACARYRVDDEREKSGDQWTNDSGRIHVLFIVHLPRGGGCSGDGVGRLGSFVGFQGGRWLSAHIDDLRTPVETVLSVDDALHTSISDLFYCKRTFPSSEEEKKERSEKAGTRDSYQCSRLYNCILPAVARVVTSDNRRERALNRVNILLDLIPQQPKFSLVSPSSISDDSLFYATLVKHIHSVLLEREKLMDGDKWVLGEAMSRKRLQSGGTFRNVLSRKLDEVITPIFAEVLVHVDRYSNLDLVTKDAPPHVQRLWLDVFTCSTLCNFSYTDMFFQEGGGLAGMGQGKLSDDEFSCQFPFFWLIKETVESQLDIAIGKHTARCE